MHINKQQHVHSETIVQYRLYQYCMQMLVGLTDSDMIPFIPLAFNVFCCNRYTVMMTGQFVTEKRNFIRLNYALVIGDRA